jgi:hypothetical protein
MEDFKPEQFKSKGANTVATLEEVLVWGHNS